MRDRCKTIKGAIIPGCWGTVHSQDKRDCYCDLFDEPTLKELINDLEKRSEQLTHQLNKMKEKQSNDT